MQWGCNGVAFKGEFAIFLSIFTIFAVTLHIDGFIAGAAAAIAQGIRPEAAQYFIGSHNSAEPGHQLIMDHIGVTMYMDLGLCLGEGTGAALFFPLLDAATRVLSEMKTLPELDITVPR